MIWRWHFLSFTAAAGCWGIWAFGVPQEPRWVHASMFLVAGLGAVQAMHFMERAWGSDLRTALALDPVERAVFWSGSVAVLVTLFFTNGLGELFWWLAAAVAVWVVSDVIIRAFVRVVVCDGSGKGDAE